MNAWIFIDHLIVSGARFGLSIVVARMLGVEDFGTYSLIWTLWAFASSLHVPVLVNPMMQLVPRVPKHRLPTLIWTIIYIQLVYSVILIPLVCLATLIFVGFNDEIFILSIAINIYIFIFNAYEQLRRYLFVVSKEKTVIFLDSIAYFWIASFMYFLVEFDVFSISSFFIASSIPVLLLIFSVITFFPKRQNISKINFVYFKKILSIIKPLTISTLSVFVSGHMFIYMTALFIGTAEVGGITAVRNLTGPFLIFLLAMDNSITRRSVLLSKESTESLHQYMNSIRLVWVPVFIFLCLVMVIYAETLIVITYGTDFKEFYELIYWMSIALIFMLLSRLQAVRLRAEGKFDVIKNSNIYSMIILSLSTPFLVYFFGMTGVGTCIVLISFSVLFFQNWLDQRSFFLWH